MVVTVGSLWRDNKDGSIVRVTKIKNNKATLFDITKNRPRQRPTELRWFGKTFNKGFVKVADM